MLQSEQLHAFCGLWVPKYTQSLHHAHITRLKTAPLKGASNGRGVWVWLESLCGEPVQVLPRADLLCGWACEVNAAAIAAINGTTTNHRGPLGVASKGMAEQATMKATLKRTYPPPLCPPPPFRHLATIPPSHRGRSVIPGGWTRGRYASSIVVSNNPCFNSGELGKTSRATYVAKADSLSHLCMKMLVLHVFAVGNV